ncbi:MAG TPA: right-handed parallel beta-helix repeat-containing protein [Sphingomicrobium sp.]|nr:right-handed parallel beta-helix repeat-containing protein [Sphingomicrobium sp.]
MRIDRRALLASVAAITATPLAARLGAQPQRVLRPEDFGARGDGTANDTRAFSRLSAEINRRGGGTVALRAGRTYIVGAQSRDGGPYAWNPAPILDFENLTRPLVIEGNGAKLRCQAGLKYGAFDPQSGAPVDLPPPRKDKTKVATPYHAMIRVRACSGSVTIHDVELDGNVDQLVIGGKYNRGGWQIPASGIDLANNRGAETIENVYSHHHALDGAHMRAAPSRVGRTRVIRLVCRNNGRQGVSLVGGRGYDFADCEFSHTGRAKIRSSPGAGVDIEAEGPGTVIRDVTFARCKFLDNAGPGLAAAAGNSADVRFSECLFVGTTSWSAWPRKPGYAFLRCTFVGPVVHAWADADPARATGFIGCRFTDDPALSPKGVFAGGGSGTIAQFRNAQNILFDGCTFNLVGAATLPLTQDAIYKDCRMSQRSTRPGRPIGRYLGTTTIIGAVNITGSIVEGSLIVNGRRLPRGVVTG